MPEIYGVHQVHPLAYIEWFTPFRTPDPLTGMYIISRSSRSHHVYAEIIEVDRLVRNCHLIPKCGKQINPDWTFESVLDKCNTFYLNSFVDYHMFCLFKLQHSNCIT